MIVGTAVFDLSLSGVNSLKEKRRILKSLLARLHNRFNVSISEVDHNDSLKTSQLGLAVVSNDKVHADRVIATIFRIIESEPEINLVDYRVEML